MDKKTYNAAVYVRLSKEDGDKIESDSITNQKDLIKDYLKTMPDINIVAEMVDDGYSGVNFERPAFMEMMTEIKAGRINCVIVKDLSRFGRNYLETGKYIQDVFPFIGVRFIAINDNYDSASSRNHTDNLVIPFKNLINDAYCRDISIKIRSQLEIKRKKGDFIGSFVAFGYLKDEENKNKIVVDEFAAEIVRDIFKWKIDGMSQQGIANKLNEIGVLSPLEYKKSIGLNFTTTFKINPKAKWSAVAVGRILKNEIYVGTLEQGKKTTPNHKVKKVVEKSKDDWIKVCDNHQAIISKEDFMLVNALLQQDTRISPNEDTVYLFSGIIFCGDCNRNMIRKTVPSGNKKYIYYICSNNRDNKTCSSHSISHNIVEEAITLAIQNHISSIINIEQILEFIETLPLKQEEIQKLDKQVIKKQEEIKRYNDLKLSLYESLLSGILDEKEYSHLKNSYTKQCGQAEMELQKLRAEIEKNLNNKTNKNSWIEGFKKYHNFNELTRKIVVSLIDKVFIYEDNKIDILFKYQCNYDKMVHFIETVADMPLMKEVV